MYQNHQSRWWLLLIVHVISFVWYWSFLHNITQLFSKTYTFWGKQYNSYQVNEFCISRVSAVTFFRSQEQMHNSLCQIFPRFCVPLNNSVETLPFVPFIRVFFGLACYKLVLYLYLCFIFMLSVLIFFLISFCFWEFSVAVCLVSTPVHCHVALNKCLLCSVICVTYG